MKLDDILDMWDTDSEIDSNQLGDSAIFTSKIHSKYLRLLIDAKLKLAKLTTEYNQYRKLRFRYYRGELTREELQTYGWNQWYFNKPLKAEMEEFLKGDETLADKKLRLEYIETIVFALESILTQIKQRDFQISSAIKWKQFLAGN